MRTHLALWLITSTLAGAVNAAAPAPTAERGALTMGKLQFERYRLTPASGPVVDYFISAPRDKAPLVLFIQGSGCSPVFIGSPAGGYYSTVFSYTTTSSKGKYAAMVVDKPYSSSPKRDAAGVPTGCGDAFNQHFSLENWVADVRLALEHALTLPYVDSSRVLVIGVSEGAPVAARLAALDRRVRHLALVGATGSSQLYDFVVNAYKEGPSDEDTRRALIDLDGKVKAIMAAPDSAMDFMWGHTYKRWSSFLRASPRADLLAANAHVYLVSGMQDKNVPILSTESLYADLLVAGQDVTMKRIPNAGHSLFGPGGNFGTTEIEYAEILAWFEDRTRAREGKGKP